jgi:hypothetical protein
VPQGYAYVMQITGYHGMPSNGGHPDCREFAGDSTRYYWYKIDSGKNYLCAKSSP